MDNSDLIFGKNKIDRIVSVEPTDEHTILFRELEDGTVDTQYIPTNYWILLPEKKYSNLVCLDGNQHYKWLFSCDNRERYLSARKKLGRGDFYSIWNPQENIMVYNGITYFKNMKINEVSILSFDIESDGLKKTKNSEIYCITNTFRKLGKVIRKGFFLDEYKSQREMLLAWCDWVREINPSILLGHNIVSYDLPYLQHVADLNNVTLSLGRDGSDLSIETRESKFRKDGSQEYSYYKPHVFGREIIDSWMLSIKYDIGRQFVSYGLKQIINQLGLEKQDRTFVDASKIKHYFYNDPEMWKKVKQYAEEDSDDSLKLFDIMAPATFYFTQSVSKSFQEMILSATGSQINNLMVRSYLQNNHSIAKGDESVPYEGALSIGVPGFYKNCVRWDVSSLYPSIMRQFKVYNPKKDPMENFVKLTDYFALERLKNKKLAKETNLRYYSDLEQSQKIGANSLYGFLGAPGLQYNYPEGASFVTRKGRDFLTIAVKWASGKTIQDLKNLIGDNDETVDE